MQRAAGSVVGMPILEICLRPDTVDARVSGQRLVWSHGRGNSAVVTITPPGKPARELVFPRRPDGAWSLPATPLADLAAPPEYQHGLVPADEPTSHGALQLFVRLEVPEGTVVEVNVR